MVGKFEQKRRFSEQESLRSHLRFKRSVSQSFASPQLNGRSYTYAASSRKHSAAANTSNAAAAAAALSVPLPLLNSLAKKRSSEPIASIGEGIVAARRIFEKESKEREATRNGNTHGSQAGSGKLRPLPVRMTVDEGEDALEPLSPLAPLRDGRRSTPSRERGARPSPASARRKLRLPFDDTNSEAQGDCTTPKNADVCI